jgi:TetR/AcrR family transcriptional regulator
MESVNEIRSPAHRLPASDRRRQLVETALDVFSRKGFGGTTTKEIAAAAGVTEAIIFRHFPTKSDLYNAVLDHHHGNARLTDCIAHWKTCMDRNDDEGLFRSMIEKVLDAHRQDLRGHRVLLFAALEGHETALEYNRQFSYPIYELLCQYVTRRQREGALRAGDPGAIIAAAYGMAEQYATMTQMFGFTNNTTDRQMADSFIDILMHGIQGNKQGNQQTQGAQL